MQIENHNRLLEKLEKAVESSTISSLVPEDLEVEAHNTLWNETDPGELTLLKLLPSIPAKQIEHKYSRIVSYGNTRNSGFFAEKSLPPETSFGATRHTVNIKLMGAVAPTYLLASLEETQKALGTTGAQNIERVAAHKLMLFKKCRNLYQSDTRTTRLGTSGLRFKGLFQMIEEGTDGTDGAASPYGSHVIDMEGDYLSVENIRNRAAKTITLFGRLTSLIMDPLVRGNMESSMDPAHRLNLPVPSNPLLIGQQIAGIQTQGGVTYFETDNTLSPLYFRPQYSTDIEDGAPSTRPTVLVNAQADDSTGDTVASKWDAASAGQVFYMVTETVNEIEGLGTRAPSTGYTTVAVGQEVRLRITPGNPLADSFKVYRGTSDDDANTDAWFIFEVANSGSGGQVTAYDNNKFRPNTSWVFGLNVKSAAERTLHNGTVNAYDTARDRSASFLQANDRPGNTVAVAHLGPDLGIMQLAAVLAQIDRPLLYSALAPEVRNPRQQVVFINVGLRN